MDLSSCRAPGTCSAGPASVDEKMKMRKPNVKRPANTRVMGLVRRRDRATAIVDAERRQSACDQFAKPQLLAGGDRGQLTKGGCSLWQSDAEHNSASRCDRCSEETNFLPEARDRIHLLSFRKRRQQSSVRTTEVQRFPRRVCTASDRSSQHFTPSRRTLPKTCGDAAKGFDHPSRTWSSVSLFQKSSVLASLLNMHQRHHRSFLTRNPRSFLTE